jgi:hypothetical protein
LLEMRDSEAAALGEAAQPSGGDPQDLVPRRLTPDLVQGAEAVQVDDHQADLLIGLAGALHRPGEGGLEALPVRQARERVAGEALGLRGPDGARKGRRRDLTA